MSSRRLSDPSYRGIVWRLKLSFRSSSRKECSPGQFLADERYSARQLSSTSPRTVELNDAPHHGDCGFCRPGDSISLASRIGCRGSREHTSYALTPLIALGVLPQFQPPSNSVSRPTMSRRRAVFFESLSRSGLRSKSGGSVGFDAGPRQSLIRDGGIEAGQRGVFGPRTAQCRGHARSDR
jgi:hypothetical protein